MLNKDKLFRALRKGYTPESTCPDSGLVSLYTKTFRPLAENKRLDLFFDMYETGETLLKAWGFLGIYHVLKKASFLDHLKKEKLKKIILDALNDREEIVFFGGTIEIRTSLREHHVRRVSTLDPYLVLEPVLEYIKAPERKIDLVVGELLETLISISKDPEAEPLIMRYSKDVGTSDFILKQNIIAAFENLGKTTKFNDKIPITNLFKQYIQDIEQDDSERREDDEKKQAILQTQKRSLKENSFRIAAGLDLDLENETLAFIKSLDQPLRALSIIAKKYRTNQKFISIIMSLLEGTNNPHIITELLRAILVIQDEMPNWKDLIFKYVNEYKLIEGDLIEEIQETGLITEEMLVDYMHQGAEWQLEFIREFFSNDTKKLDEWASFKTEFISILTEFKPLDDHPEFKQQKQLVLRLVIHLERRDMMEYCLENFQKLEDDELKKMCLFAIINLGNDAVWTKLKRDMNANPETEQYVKKFWNTLKCRDWQFFY